MANVLSVHDNRRSVQKRTATSRRVQNPVEIRHDGQQFWRLSIRILLYLINEEDLLLLLLLLECYRPPLSNTPLLSVSRSRFPTWTSV